MSFFVTFFYQPFFNILIGFYYLTGLVPNSQPDMGVAVIFLTIVIRILTLPLTIASTRTRAERRQIEEAVKQLKTDFDSQPIRLKAEIKQAFATNRRIVVSEGINFFIQLIIFFVLYHIFTTGLEGEDIHLIYEFMPDIQTPFNLLFLGKYDLAHTSFTLNLVQTLTIFAVEALSLANSPFPVTRNDLVRYLIILPLASFLIFMFLPAGKKIFVITTLIFSIFFMLISMINRLLQKIFKKLDTVGMPTTPEATTPTSTPDPNPLKDNTRPHHHN